jgi:hypothetical protein
MLEDFGIRVTIRINTDASAAKGIANRRGLGKVRHIAVNQLWIQDRISRGDLTIGKINGKEADQAVFVYALEVIFKDGETELFTGDVTLIR